METKEAEMITTEVIDSLKSRGTLLPSNIETRCRGALVNILTGKMKPKEALNVDDHFLEILYSHGYQLFQAGKYDDALLLFGLLRKVDWSDFRYSFSMAACYHYKKEYYLASGLYIFSSYLDEDNPVPYFHLYDCFMELGDFEKALSALQFVILVAGDKESYQPLKEKALLEKQHVESEISKSKVAT